VHKKEVYQVPALNRILGDDFQVHDYPFMVNSNRLAARPEAKRILAQIQFGSPYTSAL